MPDQILDFIKAGGRAATPLALASWGAYYLPIAARFPNPFENLAPWVCFLAMSSGAAAACILVFRRAFAAGGDR